MPSSQTTATTTAFTFDGWHTLTHTHTTHVWIISILVAKWVTRLVETKSKEKTPTNPFRNRKMWKPGPTWSDSKCYPISATTENRFNHIVYWSSSRTPSPPPHNSKLFTWNFPVSSRFRFNWISQMPTTTQQKWRPTMSLQNDKSVVHSFSRCPLAQSSNHPAICSGLRILWTLSQFRTMTVAANCRIVPSSSPTFHTQHILDICYCSLTDIGLLAICYFRMWRNVFHSFRAAKRCERWIQLVAELSSKQFSHWFD